MVVNGMTAHRANVILARTGSAAMGCVKAQMIDLLKEKLRNGVAHFIYKKQSTGEIREAWGTCSGQHNAYESYRFTHRSDLLLY